MNKYYVEYTDTAKRYQHSDKYKAYRRKYEAGYRDENRIAVNLHSWKVMQRKAGKRITVKKEMDYLLKRMLK